MGARTDRSPAFPVLGSPELEDGIHLISTLGGKGASLHRMCRAGLPVPPGFVVPAQEFRAALREGAAPLLQRLAAAQEGEKPPKPADLLARHPEARPLADALRPRVEAALRDLEGSAPRLVVRSSGTFEDGQIASYAGVLESYPALPAENVTAAVLLCWSTAFLQRARAYSERIGVDPDDMAIAVVVQSMVAAEVSGILHTRDPVTGEECVLIDAARGLAHVAVDGRITPDTYRCRGRSCEVQLGGQEWKDVLGPDGIRCEEVVASERRNPVLNPGQRQTLLDLAERVEQLMGGPQDIEWGIAGDRVWLLQARPITTTTGTTILWTRANLRELYPEVVSPLTASVIQRIQAAWHLEYFDKLGFELGHLAPGMRVIRGRPYLNLTLLRCLAELAGMDPRRIDANLGGSSGPASAASRPDWRRALKTGTPLLRVVRHYLTAHRTAPRVIAEAQRAVKRFHQVDLSALEDQEVFRGSLDCFRATQPLYETTADVAGALEMINTLAGLILTGDRREAFAQAGLGETHGKREVQDFERVLQIAREEPETREKLRHSPSGSPPPLEAFRGTRFCAALEEYLAQHGYRGMHEADTSRPRYAEDPSPLIAAARAAVVAGEEQPARGVSGVPGEEKEGRVSRTSMAGGPGQGPAAEARIGFAGEGLLRWMRRLMALRQEVRRTSTRLIAEQRRWELELGQRWAGRGWLERPEDYFWLTLEDIEAALEDASLGDYWLRDLVERRRERCREWAAEPMPLLWPPGAAETVAAPIEGEAEAGAIQGLPVSPGVVEGRVKVLRSLEDREGLEPDRILVASFAGPSWAPFLAGARGLVVEMGGALSHASILAREYGLPAVANVANATESFRDGERIRLDGARGLVWRLEPEGRHDRPEADETDPAADEPSEEEGGEEYPIRKAA